jgi:hypothetical protein
MRPARTLALTLLSLLVFAATAVAEPPKTGFEANGGTAWTTHAEELQFLAAVGSGSPKAKITQIGTTEQGRPLHLVEIGGPVPAGREAALKRPTALMTCSQHGNEPSGREACLKMLRDLAFLPEYAALVEQVTFLFIPSANPDGREANSRGNSGGTDINRDHITLDTPEARAAAKVVLDWEPDVALDLHEYGPSQPVVYDDSILWLWPRNLNTDQAVHDLAITLGRDYLVKSANEAGYTTDEYGQAEVADNDIAQTAGDGDEGIMRNAMGLRHVLGILTETRVDADVRQSPTELVFNEDLQNRRVDSHIALIKGLFTFMAERGQEAMRVTAEAGQRKAAEGAAQKTPVYFGGADNEEPAPEEIATPMCGYELTQADKDALGPRLELLGIQLSAGGAEVSMAQRAEPVIPLLLDARGARKVVSAKAKESGCAPPPTPVPPATATPPLGKPVAPQPGCASRRTVTLRVPRPKVRGKVVSTRATANGKKVRIRKGIALVELRKFKRNTTVVVRYVQKVRRGGKTRTVRSSVRLRTC